MIKIKSCAIFGGSFDPIHLGHLHLIREVKNSGLVDKLIVVPAGRPWQRETHAEATHRFEMAKLALANTDVAVSDCEIKRAGDSYAIDTVLEISQLYPAEKIFWVIGSDAFSGIETWHRYSELIDLVEFLVIVRPGYEVTPPDANVIWQRLEIGALDISATQIRRNIREGLPISGLVSSEVDAYIKEHGLYGAA